MFPLRLAALSIPLLPLASESATIEPICMESNIGISSLNDDLANQCPKLNKAFGDVYKGIPVEAKTIFTSYGSGTHIDVRAFQNLVAFRRC